MPQGRGRLNLPVAQLIPQDRGLMNRAGQLPRRPMTKAGRMSGKPNNLANQPTIRVRRQHTLLKRKPRIMVDLPIELARLTSNKLVVQPMPMDSEHTIKAKGLINLLRNRLNSMVGKLKREPQTGVHKHMIKVGKTSGKLNNGDNQLRREHPTGARPHMIKVGRTSDKPNNGAHPHMIKARRTSGKLRNQLNSGVSKQSEKLLTGAHPPTTRVGRISSRPNNGDNKLREKPRIGAHKHMIKAERT